MKKYLLVFFLMSVSVIMSAQVQVKGVVTASDNGQTLVGVSVFEKGTMNGVVTDLDGAYSIRTQEDDPVLVFSCIGYKTIEVEVASRGVIDVVMDVDQQLLDEVVVMGYSTKTKGEITSAVTVVEADKLQDVVTNDLGTMLQGKVAGVSVVNSSGAPGAESSIRIRGTSSMNAPQEPLYVVDGIIGGEFDPNDVESVTILKDAGSTGMYGAQANGGVIVVTTKRAASGKMKFNFKAGFSLTTPDLSRQHYMDASQLYQYYREYFRDPETYLIDDVAFNNAISKDVLNVNTNWRDYIYRVGTVQNYYLSLMGKTEKTDYYASASYYDETGIIRHSDFRRLNIRSNNTFRVTKWLTVTSNLNMTGRYRNTVPGNVLYYFDQAVPFDSPYDENGNLRYFGTADDIYSRYKNNPLLAFESEGVKEFSKSFSLNYDFVVNVQITPWLSFVSQNRIYGSTYKSHYHRIDNIETMEGGDLIDESQTFNYGGISTNMLRFKKDWKKSSFNALVGYEAQRDRDESLGATGQGLPYGLYVLDVTSKNYTASGYNLTSGMQSFISQVNYNWDQRYFITASFRIDQSSTFNAANRTAMFPSVSAAWMISNEPWFRSEAFTNLKLKASWGKTGMKDIGASKFLDSFAYTASYDNNSAAVPIQMANPDLKWEQTDQLNAGIEVGIFDRISLDLNYYRNVTNNLLVNRDLAPSVGFSSQWQNLGAVLNTGFEAALSVTPVKTKDWMWGVDFSIAYNYNRLSGFGDTKIFKSTYEGISQVYRDGASLYTWYLKEYAGINPENGRQLFVDENGNLTEDYNEARFVEAGSALAPWEGGISTYLTWKNFRLSATGNFVWGNYLYGRKRASSLTTFVANSLEPSNEDVIWRKPGDQATIGLPAASSAMLYHTGYLVKGNYFKIRDITLSYTLPKNTIPGCGLTLSLSCNNVATFTTVWGADPEVSRTDDVVGRISDLDGRYPNKRIYSLQLNFTF